eukprot:2656058-Pleurochrysis_carterae.AAC.1
MQPLAVARGSIAKRGKADAGSAYTRRRVRTCATGWPPHACKCGKSIYEGQDGLPTADACSKEVFRARCRALTNSAACNVKLLLLLASTLSDASPIRMSDSDEPKEQKQAETQATGTQHARAHSACVPSNAARAPLRFRMRGGGTLRA